MLPDIEKVTVRIFPMRPAGDDQFRLWRRKRSGMYAVGVEWPSCLRPEGGIHEVIAIREEEGMCMTVLATLFVQRGDWNGCASRVRYTPQRGTVAAENNHTIPVPRRSVESVRTCERDGRAPGPVHSL